MVDEFVRCIEFFERATKGGGEQKKLRKEFDELFHKIDLQYSNNPAFTVTPCIESLCRSICSRLHRVQDKSGGGSMKWYLRITGAFEPQQVLLDYRHMRGDLQRLLLNMDTRIWQTPDDRADDFLLESLRPSLSARYDSSEAAALHRGACTVGTRTGELRKMLDWVYNPETNSTYWLSGMAGTGKTTIVYSLCEQLDNERLLGASFFCSRSIPECREVDRIMRSIAYQLAQFSYPFRCALIGVLRKDPELFNRGVQIQFQRLITNALVQVQETMPEGLVVVIDALDECTDKDATAQILEALLNRSSHLPVKFIASSRPESVIQQQMDKQKGKRINSRLVLHEIDEGVVKTDIETYLQQALKSANPSDEQIAMLVQQAGTLFIYAATIVRYVTDIGFPGKSHVRLDQLLNSPILALTGAKNEIDALYTVILKLAIDSPGATDAEKNDIKRVLGVAICAQEPMNVRAFSFVLEMAETRVHTALQALASVLLVLKASQVVMTLHASFPDYMLDPKRSNKYCCRRKTYQEALALGCFRWIRENKSQFNICGLESPHIRDSDVPDLENRVGNAVSWELYYACRSWAAHLARTGKSTELLEQFSDFLSNRFLLWMEVMNLKHCMYTGPGILWCAEEWAKEKCGAEIVQLTHAAWRFVMDYQLGAAKLSTLHIYRSVLSFLPSSSPLWKHYRKHAHRLIFSDPKIIQRKAELFGYIIFDKGVTAVEWSPDGTRIIGIVGARIVVLNAVTCRVILEQGDDSPPVTAFTISPDSNRCATFSDSLIHVWDLHDGKLILGPVGIEEKTWDPIKAIRYSPDGTFLAYASRFYKLHLLNAQTGHLALDLGQHSNFNSAWSTPEYLLFSPNNAHIACCMQERGIRFWDVKVKKEILIPGHANATSITSFDYSPDGARIVSSRNKDVPTIYVHDLETGKVVLGPLKFQKGVIESVVYSPNGSRIASSSRDKTICVWDSQTGQVCSVLIGHTDVIHSISYSPDGTRIVSSSHDRSIRIWDVRNDQRVTGSTTGENSYWSTPVYSSTVNDNTRGSQSPGLMNDPSLVKYTYGFSDVEFYSCPPDGLYVVTAHEDGTLRIWVVATKQPLYEFKGHNEAISSIFYSPNGNHMVSCDQSGSIQVWCVQGLGKSHLTDARDKWFISGSPNPLLTLKVNPDLWITDNMSRLIVWVPPGILITELLRSERTILEILGATFPSLGWDNRPAEET
ncbi:putative vegetative incompatibility protein HET-E-1 [Rhizoctonia solani 123E]|uniref:Putative vegetative incompatibility protein HET-E-1 n=1 Tax=Rhizoctonia solani 123E TaxID=1423351 RepID=A0A074S1Y1_9AGAM|nr:putative vegetative incompatibility protein HET-E-1 [Rhizoctonia solani 123E]